MRDITFDAERDILRPIKHEHSNSVMLGPEGTDVADLHVELVESEHGDKVVLSTWELTDEQRQRIADGAQITLLIFQHPIPPVALTLDGPLEALDEDDRDPARVEDAEDPNEAAVRRDFRPGPSDPAAA